MTGTRNDSPPAELWSFVIPCLNEERFIGRTIADIHRYAVDLPYEIVLADHGSTDDSVQIATRAGAQVVSARGVSLGELRNVGARAAKGSILIYLDADTSLTPSWRKHIRTVVESLPESRILLTGSMAAPHPSSGWIALAWEIGRPTTGPIRSLSGAHMIMRRDHFFSVGAFPDDADSGEDEALSARVWRAGGEVVANPRLAVIHRGAPVTLKGFFGRHFWHGVGDAKSLAHLASSRTALAALTFIFFHLLFILTLVLGELPLASVFAVLILGLPAALARRRTRRFFGAKYVHLLILFAVYLWARGIAALLGPFGFKPSRNRVTAPDRVPPGSPIQRDSG